MAAERLKKDCRTRLFAESCNQDDVLCRRVTYRPNDAFSWSSRRHRVCVLCSVVSHRDNKRHWDFFPSKNFSGKKYFLKSDWEGEKGTKWGDCWAFCSFFFLFRFIYKNHHLLSNWTRRTNKLKKNSSSSIAKDAGDVSERETHSLCLLLNEIFSAALLLLLLHRSFHNSFLRKRFFSSRISLRHFYTTTRLC